MGTGTPDVAIAGIRVPVTIEHQVGEAVKEVADAGGQGRGNAPCARRLGNLLAFFDPLIPGVLGDALRQLQARSPFRADEQHCVFRQSAVTFGALELDLALEDLDLEESLVEVNPEARVAMRKQRGAPGLDYVKVVILRDEIERRITLVKG